jgi:MtrB/PioB family decaheme-associated outer membrane protein
MSFPKCRLKARSAILIAGTLALPDISLSEAFAADSDTPPASPIAAWTPPVSTKAPPASTLPVPPDWYFYGGLEAGLRALIDPPPSGFGTTSASSGGNCTVGGGSVITTCFLTASQTQSRAKFDEYGSIANGPFLDWINLQTGTKDGRFALDFWGRSVGYNNQSYTLDVSKPGEQYLTLGWDQIPHLISTSAKTVFFGAGSTSLTVNPALQAGLQPFMPAAADATAAGAIARNNIEALINNAEMPLTLGTRRDRATGAYRWTPTAQWDFGVEYSHEQRTGAVPGSIPVFWDTASPAFPHYPIGLPVPVNDTTQDVEAKGEYAGTTLWGMKWNTNVVYNGSLYHNNLTQLDAQNPFCAPGSCDTLAGPFFAPNNLRLSLDPSNQANAVTWTTAVDVPIWKTRYVSTLQFNDMRQNDPFINTSINGLIAPPVTTLNGVPVGSLSGQIDTFLWNNVLTMRPTNDLKLTFRGRHYEVDNNTPVLKVADWIANDTQCASGAPNPDGTCSNGPKNSLPISYTKDNASAEARWNVARWLALGGGWAWERWDRTFRDANITNENTGKIFADLTPNDTVVARASYQYGVRRYETYDPALFVLTPGIEMSQVASNMRRFDLANRNRQKADAQVQFAATDFLTITPNFGLLWDDYPDSSVVNPLGLRNNHSWNAGIEFGALVNRNVRLMFAYNYDDTRRNIAGGNGAAAGCPLPLDPNTPNPIECTWFSDTHQQYHTFMAAADWKVIPNKFDLRFEAIYTIANESDNLTPCAAGNGCNGLNGLDPAFENFGQFPNQSSTYQRYNVIARYYVDPDFVRRMGWIGDVIIKGRYTYISNHISNWAINDLTPYVPTPDAPNGLEGGGRSLFLAWNNPNYSSHVLAMSVAFKW